MNRVTLVIIIVASLATSFVVCDVTHSKVKISVPISLRSPAKSNDLPQLSKASSRLIFHSKMIAVESLIITKHSINLVFDKVINAL